MTSNYALADRLGRPLTIDGVRQSEDKQYLIICFRDVMDNPYISRLKLDWIADPDIFLNIRSLQAISRTPSTFDEITETIKVIPNHAILLECLEQFGALFAVDALQPIAKE